MDGVDLVDTLEVDECQELESTQRSGLALTAELKLYVDPSVDYCEASESSESGYSQDGEIE